MVYNQRTVLQFYVGERKKIGDLEKRRQV